MTVATDAVAPLPRPGTAARGAADRSADEAVTAMYYQHYAPLVRTAVLLVDDLATAEDVVQDSFIALHCSWWRLRNPRVALAYLHRTVLNRSRSVLRRRSVASRYAPGPPLDLPSAEDSALARLHEVPVRTALSTLPVRQRQVIMLRYYAELSEAEIAAAMGITRGAVKAHASRARDSLRAALR